MHSSSREISGFLVVQRITRQLSFASIPALRFFRSIEAWIDSRRGSCIAAIGHIAERWSRREDRGRRRALARHHRRSALAARRRRALPARLRRRDLSALERWAGHSQQRSRPSRCDVKRQRLASVRSTRQRVISRSTLMARDPCSACAPPRSKTSATFLYLGCRK